MDNKEVLDLVEKKAVEVLMRYDACARGTMEGLQCHFNFIPDELVAATLSLSGGIGASSGSCGAYCSGLLAIGMKYNPLTVREDLQEDLIKKDISSDKLIAFREAFLGEFGTTLCPEIHKIIFGRSFNFLDHKQLEEFMKMPDHTEKCASVVARAARMAAEILLEDDI